MSLVLATTSPPWALVPTAFGSLTCPGGRVRLACPRPIHWRQGEANASGSKSRQVQGRQAPRCGPQVAQSRRRGPRPGEAPGGGSWGQGGDAATAPDEQP